MIVLPSKLSVRAIQFMDISELIDSWNNGWLVHLSEQYKDDSGATWIDAKFSRPTKEQPIPAHFVTVRFRIEDGKPVSYFIESDRTEKKVSVAIVDATLQMHLRIKAKCGGRARDLGLLP